MCVSLQKIGFETAEARLAPGSYNTSVHRQGYNPSLQQQYKQLIICTQNVQFCSSWPKPVLPTKQSSCKIDACFRCQVKNH